MVGGLNGVMFGVKNSKKTGPLNVAKEFELCINRIENHDLTDLPLIGIWNQQLIDNQSEWLMTVSVR